MTNLIDSFRLSMARMLQRPTLTQRRRRRTLRHVAISLLAGLCVMMTLQAFTANTATRTVVVAAHTLSRGDTLTQQDVALRSVADNPLWQNAPSTLDAVTGQVLQLEVPDGEPLFTSMLSVAPTVPEGFTSIAVSVASEPTGITTGMTVSLVASAMPDCPEAAADATHTCTVSNHAMVMQPPATDDLTGATSQVFALNPEDAVAVIAAEKVTDIMVVSRAD